MTQRRPYRSHKVPACDRCRRFKRRCTGRPCVLCNLQEVPCEYTPSSLPKGQSASTRSARRTVSQRTARQSPLPNLQPRPSTADREDEHGERVSDYHGGPNQARSKPELSMVANPVISEDIRILERYMSSQAASRAGSSVLENNPMVYMKISRRREGLAITENPGKQQKETLMQILRSNANELIDLYFEHIHPAFPLFDQDSFIQLYRENKVSPTLICDFFAVSQILWNLSPTLRKTPPPDPMFVWNLAVEALQQDFLVAGISTLYAVVLDMAGRPIYAVLQNAINSGRAVSLALSLGLNRNPSGWKRPAIEIHLRKRLWWAVLIHDYWSSFAHGTPPMIRKDQYDVPVPAVSDLEAGLRHPTKSTAFVCFSSLCRLTLILGDILPLAYNLTIDQQDIWKQIRRLEFDLDAWDDCLPDEARPLDGDGRRIPGCSSLRLGYLSVRLLLKRVALHAAAVSSDADRKDNVTYHLSQLRRSAQEIVNYTCGLTKAQLQEFWLPYTAHHLILTVIILLRCTVESPEPTIAEKCRTDLDRLWTKLQSAANDGWDLANICITRCAESVSKILAMSVPNLSSSATAVTAVDPIEIGPSALLELPDLGSGSPMHHHIAPEMMPDILPFSNPDISFDNHWDVGALAGLGFMDVFPNSRF
ncbi:fungal-specific transcription factor domain-containing protein [Aspergillus pseudoustus]|uniref:Fungal-specific transcription factor domain-containing protein n=1 Tax=Aspergillus pseudoustus TaxID=1810923 RepID=A0ABR4KI55_9EURO